MASLHSSEPLAPVLRSPAARGDSAAFATVYERHHQALYRYCRSILRHDQDAQDALQNTMLRAFAALQDERRDFELRPWLFRIAHNEAISIMRRRLETAELGDALDRNAPVEDRVAEREELRVLRRDLADLSDRQRAALVLRELNGLRHGEIARVLDVSPGTVKQAIFEARSALSVCREGRNMVCGDVRRMLSDGDGRVIRGRGVRAHLRACAGCRGFRTAIERRPRELAALAPPLPAVVGTGLLAALLDASGTATVAATSTATGGIAVKLLISVAVAGGGVAAVSPTSSPPPQRTSADPPARKVVVAPRASAPVAIVAAKRQPTTVVVGERPRTKGEKTADRPARVPRPGGKKARSHAPSGAARTRAGHVTPAATPDTTVVSDESGPSKDAKDEPNGAAKVKKVKTHGPAQPTSQGDAQPESQGDQQSNGKADGKAKAQGNGNANGQGNANANGNANGHATEGNAKAKADKGETAPAAPTPVPEDTPSERGNSDNGDD